MSQHKQCEDCGKCRVIHFEDWCGDCEGWSCERGDDCADAVTARDLLGAAPDFTGGLSVDEYMDEQRGRGEG